MAITALVAVVAYSGLSAAVSGAESLRGASGRAHEIHQTMGLLSSDLRQTVNRPVIDEFGQLAPALSGGELARNMLSLTRAGWHNSTAAPRSGLHECTGGWKMIIVAGLLPGANHRWDRTH